MHYHELVLLLGNGVDRIDVTHIADLAWVKDAIFDTQRHSIERRKSLLFLIAISPRSLIRLFFSGLIHLFGHLESFLEHLFNDVAVPDSNRSCSFNKCKHDFGSCHFFVVHELR